MENETIGERIERLRTAKGWSRPELGRQMALAIERKKSFSGELIRLYEEEKNRPRGEARRALALVFDRPEQYIEYGSAAGAKDRAQEPEGPAYNFETAAALTKAIRKLRPELRRALGSIVLALVRTPPRGREYSLRPGSERAPEANVPKAVRKRTPGSETSD